MCIDFKSVQLPVAVVLNAVLLVLSQKLFPLLDILVNPVMALLGPLVVLVLHLVFIDILTLFNESIFLIDFLNLRITS